MFFDPDFLNLISKTNESRNCDSPSSVRMLNSPKDLEIFLLRATRKKPQYYSFSFWEPFSTFLGMGMFRSPPVLWFPWFGNFISQFDFFKSFYFGTEFFKMRVL